MENEICDICKKKYPSVMECADRIYRCEKCRNEREKLQEKYHTAIVGNGSDPCKER